jgi:hypothetical protein
VLMLGRRDASTTGIAQTGAAVGAETAEMSL